MTSYPSSASARSRAVGAATALLLSAGLLMTPGAAQADVAKADVAKAKALKGKVSRTVPLTCQVFGNEFVYRANIKLSGKRAKQSVKKVALTATLSDMPGVAPVPIDHDTTAKLTLVVGGAKRTLTGSGHSKAAANQPVSVPTVKGSVSNKKNSLAVKVSRFELTIPSYQLTITCVPTGAAGMGKLKLK